MYTLCITLTGFAVNIALMQSTKYVYETYDYRHPLFITCSHMVASYLFAAVALHGANLVPERRRLSLQEQLREVVPFALLGTLSVACGNTALLFIYPPLHEMIQNTTPLWTVVSSMVLVGSRYNGAAYAAMLPVSFGGVLCATADSGAVAAAGLFFSVSATVTRAVRAIVQARLLRGREPIDSLTLLYYASPFNLALFATGSLVFEGLAPVVGLGGLPADGFALLGLGALLAAMYNLLAFMLVGHTGAVAAMAINNLKTPTVMLVTQVVFGKVTSFLQLVGFGVTALGVAAYSAYGLETRQAGGLFGVRWEDEESAYATKSGDGFLPVDRTHGSVFGRPNLEASSDQA